MIHNTIHIVDSIVLHGPLIEYTAFSFESYNSVIMNAIKGTYRVEKTIANAIPLRQILSYRLKIIAQFSKDQKALETFHKLKASSICHLKKIVSLHCFSVEIFSITKVWFK